MLTRKQFELLRFINERLKEAGVPPSFDEMKDALDLRSKSGIHRLITALEERGFIRRLPNRARAHGAAAASWDGGMFVQESTRPPTYDRPWARAPAPVATIPARSAPPRDATPRPADLEADDGPSVTPE